jgi:hypothetical protein
MQQVMRPIGYSAGAAQQGNAADAFGPEPVRFPMFVRALARLIQGERITFVLLSPSQLG